MPKGSKVKQVTPPEPPKKALTPFFQFRKDVYEQVKQDNPDVRITKITEIIGEQWRNLDAEDKSKYEKQYNKDKDRYEREKDKYERKYGKIEPKPKKVKKAK